jgi:hypothetical protein
MDPSTPAPTIAMSMDGPPQGLKVIVVVKKTFRLRNAFFVTTLMPKSFFGNIILTIGINNQNNYLIMIFGLQPEIAAVDSRCAL